MFTYLASILQDTCDFGFKSCLGAHALILSNIEDQTLTWDDLPAIQKVTLKLGPRQAVGDKSVAVITLARIELGKRFGHGIAADSEDA